MTYPALALGLVLLAAAVRLLAEVVARRRGHRIPLAPTIVAALALTVLTAVFDNVMLAVGVDDYAPHLASGVRIGRAPIEDFSYPLATALLLPGLWELTRRRGDDEHGAGQGAERGAGHGTDAGHDEVRAAGHRVRRDG